MTHTTTHRAASGARPPAALVKQQEQHMPAAQSTFHPACRSPPAFPPATGSRTWGVRNATGTTAMHMLQAGVDISVIALWLGHESPTTTHHYVEADLTMKERALATLHEPAAKIQRYRAPDSFIDFLKTL